MSKWQDRIQTEYTLITGDGKVYVPLYLVQQLSKHVEFNIATFVFKNVRGELVKRGTNKGDQYEIEVIFQGDDCVEVGREFLESAKYHNTKTGYAPPIEIVHPLYDTIYVQPIYVTLDNSKLNNTVVKMLVVETLKEIGKPYSSKTPDAIATDSVTINTSYAESYAVQVPVVPADSLTVLKDKIGTIYGNVMAAMTGVQENIDSYTLLYNRANSVLNTALYDSYAIISAAQNMLYAPAYFSSLVSNRVAMLVDQLKQLALDVANILALTVTGSPTRARKKLYENNAGTIVSALCVAMTTNITTDYDKRPDVVNLINTLTGAYNDYIGYLCELQSDNGGEPDSYIPDAESLNALGQLVSATVDLLFDQYAQAKQMRTYTVPYNMNVMNAAYLLYKDINTDVAAQQLISDNNIGYNELFVIEKDRVLVYYV